MAVQRIMRRKPANSGWEKQTPVDRERRPPLGRWEQAGTKQVGNPGLETGVVEGHEAVDVADGAAGPDAPEEPADQHDQVQAERPFHHCKG